MVRVGLTGGIATGKSTVAAALAARGAYVIDADVLAREVVEPGTPGLASVVERFGADLLADDGRLDRARLGRLVFTDPAARRDLERIVHPAVRRRAAQLEHDLAPGTVVVHVIPLLVETGQAGDFDVVVVVDADPEAQVARLAARNGYSRAEAEARIGAQASRGERLAAADLVIDTTGPPAAVPDQVDRLWSALTAADPAG